MSLRRKRDLPLPMSSPESSDNQDNRQDDQDNRQDNRTEEEPSVEDDSTGDDPVEDAPESASSKESVSEAMVKTAECQNCGRHFVGDYCPACGQAAAPPDSILGVLSVFFRELVDIEGGLWASMWALTARPGTALSGYLSGARQQLMHPGRYLLASIVVAFGTDRALTWIGMRTPYDERISEGLTQSESSEMAPETAAQLQSLLVSAADRIMESQAYLIGINLILTGFLSLTVWRLFRRHFERGAQASAFSALVVGHTVFLETAAELLYVPAVYLSSGPSSGLPTGATAFITTVYIIIATMGAFGGGWKSGAKGLLATGWAVFEQALVLAIVIGGYFRWIIYARLGDDFAPGRSFSLSYGDTTGDTMAVTFQVLPAVAVLLIPFALHAGLELYYRRR